MTLYTYSDFSKALREDTENASYEPGAIAPIERFWVEHYQWLLSNGYQLRPRYAPNWKPSWIGTTKKAEECEDGRDMNRPRILDATRTSDNAPVVLKSIWGRVAPDEIPIHRYLLQNELEAMPNNYCVPVIDILEVPNHENHHVLVMPQLRPFNNPRMETIGEAIDFFRQIFSGLKFLHDRKIAHRDCCGQNILMDAHKIYPEGYDHLEIDKKRGGQGKARHYSRTEKPPRYHLIDFGLSCRYDHDGPYLEFPLKGGDKTAPEHQDEERTPCDPFPTDIYYLGNLIKMEFVEPNFNFGFMRALANDMTQEDPSKRPKIDEVVDRFNKIMKRLSWFRLRSRIVPRSDLYFPPTYVVKEIIHVFRTAGYILRGLPALPPQPTPRTTHRVTSNGSAGAQS